MRLYSRGFFCLKEASAQLKEESRGPAQSECLQGAYRRLALQYHPDRSDCADRLEAQRKFLEIREAPFRNRAPRRLRPGRAAPGCVLLKSNDVYFCKRSKYAQ